MQSIYGVRSIAQSLGVDSRDVLARMGGTTGQKLLTAMAPRQGDWFRIENKSEDDGRARLYLYDEIGWFGTTAADFAEQLFALDVDEIDVHINSVGGSVFDGIAIYNALRTHDAHVTTQVDSAALSIASVIAQAGDKRVMVSGSQMMIHEAWGMAIGNADDMRETGSLLDRQTENIAQIYAERVGGSGKKKHFLSLMQGETWLNAEETVGEGLADEVLTPATKKPSDDGETTPGLDEKETQDRWAEQFIAAASTIDP